MDLVEAFYARRTCCESVTVVSWTVRAECVSGPYGPRVGRAALTG